MYITISFNIFLMFLEKVRLFFDWLLWKHYALELTALWKWVFTVWVTSRSTIFRLVRCLCQWSWPEDLDSEFSSNVAYLVSVFEKMRKEEEDCAVFDFLPLWKGEVFLVCFLLRWQEATFIIELSSYAFDDDSVSGSNRSMSSSSFLPITHSIFLLLRRPIDSARSRPSARCLCNFSANAFVNSSEWDE